MHWGWDGGWWMMGIGTIVWLLVIVLVVWLVVRALTSADRRRDHGPGPDEALEVLRRRFANGRSMLRNSNDADRSWSAVENG